MGNITLVALYSPFEVAGQPSGRCAHRSGALAVLGFDALTRGRFNANTRTLSIVIIERFMLPPRQRMIAETFRMWWKEKKPC